MRLRPAHLAAALAALLGCRSEGPIAIRVTTNGFEPALVRVAAGQRVRLVVTRVTDQTCATEIVIPDARVNVPLPLNQPVPVELDAPRAGRLRFSCAMGMLGGVIEVR